MSVCVRLTVAGCLHVLSLSLPSSSSSSQSPSTTNRDSPYLPIYPLTYYYRYHTTITLSHHVGLSWSVSEESIFQTSFWFCTVASVVSVIRMTDKPSCMCACVASYSDIATSALASLMSRFTSHPSFSCETALW